MNLNLLARAFRKLRYVFFYTPREKIWMKIAAFLNRKKTINIISNHE